MADKTQKWDDNVPGRYYVDDRCIKSKYCVAAAPNNFRMSPAGHAYVFKQPETPEEEAQCRDALSGCPVIAIGDDGEETSG